MNRNFTTIDNIFGIPSCGDGGHAIGWDATGKVITCQAVNGILGSPASSTQAVGNGTIFVSQPKPRFDVRDYGVTGNGSDESTQLQNAINAACSSAGASAELVSPSIAISVASTVHFTQCKGIHIDFGSGQGQSSNTGGVIQWIGANHGGPVVSLDRTRDSIFENFAVFAASGHGANGADIAIDIDESSSSGGITTNNLFRNVEIWSGTQNASFIGFRLGASAPGNIEQQAFQNIQIQCIGPPTANNAGTGFYIDAGTGAESFWNPIYNFGISSCSRAIDLIHQNQLVDIGGGLMDNNYTDLYYEGGSITHYHDIRSEGATAPIVITGGNDLVAERVAFAGESAGITAIDLTNAISSTRIFVSHAIWDNVAMTPISPNLGGSTVTQLEFNKYPTSACPNMTQFHGQASDRFSVTYAANCDNVVGPITLTSILFINLPAAASGTMYYCTDCE